MKNRTVDKNRSYSIRPFPQMWPRCWRLFRLASRTATETANVNGVEGFSYRITSTLAV